MIMTEGQTDSLCDHKSATSDETASKAGSSPSKKKRRFSRFIKSVLKTLKAETIVKKIKGGLQKSSKTKKLSSETKDPDCPSKIFTSPLSTDNFKGSQLQKSTETGRAHSTPEHDIDDIDLEDEEPILIPAKGHARSKGKVVDDEEEICKPVRRSAGEIRERYGRKPSGDVAGVAGQARDRLNERQHKLKALAKRTESLEEQAQSFATLAEELANAKERRKWWQL